MSNTMVTEDCDRLGISAATMAHTNEDIEVSDRPSLESALPENDDDEVSALLAYFVRPSLCRGFNWVSISGIHRFHTSKSVLGFYLSNRPQI